MKALWIPRIKAGWVLLGVALGLPLGGLAAGLSVSPGAVGSAYRGLVTLTIDGLTNAESVLVEKLIDANTNGVVNKVDTLVESLELTDGAASVIGGVTNRNVPGDLNPTNGVITTQLRFDELELDHAVARYLFRLSSPSGRFTSTNALFRVTNAAYPQSVIGSIRCSGTNVPYALTALLDVNRDGQFAGGGVANSNGNFNLRVLPGTYRLVAIKNGYVCNESSAPTFQLSAGGGVSNNVELIPATQTLSGQLVDAANTNRGLAGAQLFVGSTNGDFALGFTDSNGVWNVPVTAGQWGIEVDNKVLARKGYVGLPDDVMVDASAGSVSNLVMALPQANALVYGTLTDTTNAPIRRVEINAECSIAGLSTRATTDTNGSYVLGVTADQWRISPSSDSLALLGYLQSSETNVTLTAEQALQVNLKAQAATAWLAGWVTDEATNPVVNLGLQANNSFGSYVWSRTGADGRFTLGVVAGTWYLEASRDDAWEQRFVYPIMDFTVAEGERITNISYPILRATNSISGTLRDYLGQPLSEAWIYASAEIAGRQYYAGGAQTSSNGTYQLFVANGTWAVGVECFDIIRRDYQCPALQMVTPTGGQGQANFTAELPEPPTLTALGLFPDGQFHLRVNGPSGFNYQVQSSWDLTNWFPVFFAYGAGTPFEVADPTSVGQPQRFYRVQRFTP